MNARVTLPELSEEDVVRGDCYRVLARLFAAAPNEAFIAVLRDAASGSEQGLGEAWNALCKVGADGTAATLADEYTALFVSIGEPKVVLYGSWYLTGSMMDFPLAQLRSDLARLGFARVAEVRETEDHIAALCEVMALLNAGDESKRAAQREFFKRHLAPWYAKFCDRLAAEGSEFYRAAAGFARGFLDGEAELWAH